MKNSKYGMRSPAANFSPKWSVFRFEPALVWHFCIFTHVKQYYFKIILLEGF